MQIVHERPTDAALIETLLNDAFGPGRSAKTVYKLREGVAHDPALAFVALEDGALRGSIRYWPILIGAGQTPAVLLGPLAVDPAHKGRGFGKALMRHSLAHAASLGHRIVVLVGDPEYYNPFGFTREKALDLALPGPVEERRFLALELVSGALDGVTGMIQPSHPQTRRLVRRRAA
ncbi:MAG: N-acetyltransferase [Alphaproteobacteria bacterium]|nr:N-acetyltransferase [Alphaproteobacteria bacterium]MBU0798687.1 N-acetyltransferase [Alphaproteobacteria bacterium]MBU0885950.1 N-acetyltransferase [Alphaproteobacteria bacterium]MBU1811939.1 N-acetyltransferase [Alphaproteobacteria bacterium]